MFSNIPIKQRYAIWVLLAASLWGSGCPSSGGDDPSGEGSHLNQPSPFSEARSRPGTANEETSAWRELRSVAVGERFICGLSSEGRVYCWGSERYGELGDGRPLESQEPWPVGPLRGMGRIVAIHANRGFACGISEERRVYCWGNNYYGQLGNGSTENHATPVLVEGLPPVTTLALGGTHACALTNAATVFCWGDNRSQQLGKSAPDRVLSARLMRGLGAVEQIALGNRSSCFRRQNRSVVCMGSNRLGELGRGISSKELVSSGEPSAVRNLPPVRQLEGYADHYCALTAADSVYCWGGEEPLTEREENRRQRRIEAELPVEPRPTPHIPAELDGLDNAQQVAVGLGFSCVLKRSGQVYCWGENSYGQLGSGSQSDRDDPSPVAAIHDATDVWVGSRNACVRDPGGRMLCWGDNRGGQLGNGGYVTALVPTPVMEPPSERQGASN